MPRIFFGKWRGNLGIIVVERERKRIERIFLQVFLHFSWPSKTIWILEISDRFDETVLEDNLAKSHSLLSEIMPLYSHN
jgi:hypothetical protein